MTIPSGYDAMFDLLEHCSVFVSFVGGFGGEYRCRRVEGTPCWIQVALAEPQRMIDNVLQKYASLLSSTQVPVVCADSETQ